jgi:G:T-mismatch repair DNA endonuclease (very short patch repair protein)
VDILSYLAPGFNYDKFLRAFGCSVMKGFLPYEWIDSLDKLEYPELPSHDAFYSRLKQENITAEDYSYCLRVWKENDMQTFRDFLVWYNNRDVVPFLEAIENQSAFYAECQIDMLKDGISVPGLTMKYLFQMLPRDTFFTLYDTRNQDLHHLVKDNIVGGPSLIFHRHHEKGETKLREAEYGDEAETCQGVVGFDANALYLSALMDDMPSGWYVRRKRKETEEEKNFAPVTSHKMSRMAVEWLEWTMAQERIHIRHEFNGKEKRLGQRQLPVDGWCAATQTAYEFGGCYWHGHDCRLNRKEFNPTRNKSMQELREETAEKIAYLRGLGYKVVQLWECEWQQMKAKDRDLQRFIATRFRRRLDKKQELTEEEILDAVKSGELFGLVECDIHVPEELHSHFAEMQPIFKNVNITRDDIGETMRAYAEENNIMRQPRRSLVGSYKGEKILLATPLLQWYMEHGLVVTTVYQVVQYWPDSCFAQFGEEVSNARRAGDRDPDWATRAMGRPSPTKRSTEKSSTVTMSRRPGW